MSNMLPMYVHLTLGSLHRESSKFLKSHNVKDPATCNFVIFLALKSPMVEGFECCSSTKLMTQLQILVMY